MVGYEEKGEGGGGIWWGSGLGGVGESRGERAVQWLVWSVSRWEKWVVAQQRDRRRISRVFQIRYGMDYIYSGRRMIWII